MAIAGANDAIRTTEERAFGEQAHLPGTRDVAHGVVAAVGYEEVTGGSRGNSDGAAQSLGDKRRDLASGGDDAE